MVHFKNPEAWNLCGEVIHEESEATAPCSEGELTGRGQMQMRHLGKALQSVYMQPGLWKKAPEEADFKVRSTNKARTIASVTNLLVLTNTQFKLDGPFAKPHLAHRN